MCLFYAKEDEARHRLNLRVILNANSRLSNSANDKIFINSIHVFSVSLVQQNSSPLIHCNNNKNLPYICYYQTYYLSKNCSNY